MGAHAAESDDNDEGGPELGETSIAKEDAVARELLKDQLVIVFASPRPGRNEGAAGIFLGGQGRGRGGAVFSELYRTS